MTPLLLCSDSVFIQPGGVSESMKHGPSSSLDNICVGSSLGVLSLEKVIVKFDTGIKIYFFIKYYFLFNRFILPLINLKLVIYGTKVFFTFISKVRCLISLFKVQSLK